MAPQRTATDPQGGNGITAPDRVPAVDLRDPQYIPRNEPVVDAPADPEPVLPLAQTQPQFSAEAIEQARRQEREKLNKRLEAERAKSQQYNTELEELRAYREQVEAEQLAKQRSEKDLTAKERLDLREAEWAAQREADRNEMQAELAQIRREREQEKAKMSLERQEMALKDYIRSRVAQELKDETIAPQFVKFITGFSEEEVDASIEMAKESTAEILADIAGQQTAATQRRGVSTATGPSSMGSVSEVESEEPDWTKVSFRDYVKNRSHLMHEEKDQGIFG
jgi:hypothetical protein